MRDNLFSILIVEERQKRFKLFQSCLGQLATRGLPEFHNQARQCNALWHIWTNKNNHIFIILHFRDKSFCDLVI